MKVEVDFKTIPFTSRQKKRLERILVHVMSRWYEQAEKRKNKKRKK